MIRLSIWLTLIVVALEGAFPVLHWFTRVSLLRAVVRRVHRERLRLPLYRLILRVILVIREVFWLIRIARVVRILINAFVVSVSCVHILRRALILILITVFPLILIVLRTFLLRRRRVLLVAVRVMIRHSIALTTRLLIV